MKKPLTHLLQPDKLILIFLALNLLLGLAVADDFGQSWEEAKALAYGQRTLSFYRSFDLHASPKAFGAPDVRVQGPFFNTASAALVKVVKLLSDQIDPVSVLHMFYFLAFNLALFSFYQIARRMMASWAALAGTLLFASQPLFYGHAFIDPKDMPLMAFFLLAVYRGWVMVEGCSSELESQEEEGAGLTGLVRQDWGQITPRRQAALRIQRLLWVSAALLYVLGKARFHELVDKLVFKMFYANDTSFLGQVFDRVVQNAADLGVEAYQIKAAAFADRLAVNLLIFGLVVGVLYHLEHLPAATRWVWQRFARPAVKGFSRSLPANMLAALKDRNVLLAGICLGMAAAAGITGLAAGGLVILLLIFKSKEKAAGPALVYLAIGAVAVYLLWPYLWASPFRRLAEVFAANPVKSYPGAVLFGGRLYNPGDLPRLYVPTLMAIKLTEPLILLSFVGFIAAARKTYQAKMDWVLMAAASLWFALPLFFSVYRHSSQFDDFGQAFFMLPPLFIFSGWALEYIHHKLDQKYIFGLLLVLMLLPGLYGAARLHPYEYTYYNKLVRGTGGAFRAYETDYWGTSFKEAMEYINQTAEPNARIAVWGPAHIAQLYARPDLKVASSGKTNVNNFDYALILTRGNRDLFNLRKKTSLFEVKRYRAILSVVKQIKKK